MKYFPSRKVFLQIILRARVAAVRQVLATLPLPGHLDMPKSPILPEFSGDQACTMQADRFCLQCLVLQACQIKKMFCGKRGKKKIRDMS